MVTSCSESTEDGAKLALPKENTRATNTPLTKTTNILGPSCRAPETPSESKALADSTSILEVNTLAIADTG